MPPKDEVAAAIHDAFVSPNVNDSNLEAANVVDVIHQLAVAVHGLNAAFSRMAAALDVIARESKKCDQR